MRLDDINKWIEDVERARFHLPSTDAAQDAEDIIDSALEQIKSGTLTAYYSFERILDLQGLVRTLLRNFDIFV